MGDELEVCSGRGRNRENGSTENQKQKGGGGGGTIWRLVALPLGVHPGRASSPHHNSNLSKYVVLKVTFSNEPIYR